MTNESIEMAVNSNIDKTELAIAVERLRSQAVTCGLWVNGEPLANVLQCVLNNLGEAERTSIDLARIENARMSYVDDDCEIDNKPSLSHGENGAWVAAWVWVSNTDICACDGDSWPRGDIHSAVCPFSV